MLRGWGRGAHSDRRPSPTSTCVPATVPALQIQKSAQHYTEAAQDEVVLLSQLKSSDRDDAKHCVRLHDHFEHSGPHGRHVCLVFEVLGDNLLALIKRYDYKGVPIPIVRNLTRQMLVALDFMHRWGALPGRQDGGRGRGEHKPGGTKACEDGPGSGRGTGSKERRGHVVVHWLGPNACCPLPSPSAGPAARCPHKRAR